MEQTTWMKQTDDWQLVDPTPKFLRIDLTKDCPNGFYVNGKTFSYKIVVKDNKTTVYRRLLSFREHLNGK
jgi:hypothetical protein